ncbi:L,D-transpeptidase family protein [Bradyrhizobium sp. LHD-71]|uniref:L,D-transpeptidase family protein n=1 Tax=Bradyrhizobium sp. LHD-71 TaxID=3072141 RepID=UPI00280E7C85|nr:L,D-transpeptidase family protein [Bradyrhizobium sp. LHD-71]MDQ8726911.1 L,D-transpeptidase family protein [Bradyrhizobium sp. LHD-71]
MRNVRNDRGGYDRIIAAAVVAIVAMAASNASAQSNPATTPAELAIDAAVPMPEPANAPPPSRADVNALASGHVTGESAKSGTEATAETTPAATAPTATATAPTQDDRKPEEAKKDDTAAKPSVATAPETAAPAAEPAKDEPARDTAAAPANTNIAVADQPIAERISDLLASRAARVFDRKDDRTAAEAFYKARDYAPLWIENGTVSVRAKAAIVRLKVADADGLMASDYPVPDFAADSTPDALADADLRLTASVLDYARHAQGGRLHYTRVSADIAYPEHNPEPADILSNMATTQDAAAALDSYNPQHKGYKALKAKLAELRGTSETTLPKIEEGPALRFVKNAKNARKPVAVMEDARVPQLRARLGIGESADDVKYDETVAAAVRRFQADSGLKVTGVLDGQTVRAMNSPKRGRTIDLIVANMERWRWLPRELGEPKLGNAYVMLNIPDFTLKVMHNGTQAWTTRVVVGKPGKQATPELTETMKYITVNPTWNVPPSIVYGEYLPALQQDPTVLERMGLRLTQRSDGSVHISQPPGAGNALGRIRFNFPNRFLVYQHDTPDKHLFAHETRAYSHGCMRVQNPENYAETLLSIVMPKENYTAARIRSMFGSSEVDIRFPTPIPVHLVYHTAFIDDTGHLQTRRDIYGRDARLIDVLRGGDRQSMEIAVNHAKPSYSRPPTTLPPGVAGANSYSSGGPRNFFEALFGIPSQPAPPPQRPQRRVPQRQAAGW